MMPSKPNNGPTAMDTGPGGSPQGGGAGSGDKRAGLMAVNDLAYALDPDLSVAVNRTHKVHHFQNQSYQNGQHSICILNSGADYIDTRNSFLQFDVLLGVAGKVGWFGKHGSALNLIESITISTRSGDELTRIRDVAGLSNILTSLTQSRDWLQNQGGAMLYNGRVYDNAAQKRFKNRVSIPLYCLGPLFSYGRLMPAMLMSGLRIEIEWNSPDKAFITHPTAGIDAVTGGAGNIPLTAAQIDALMGGITSFTIERPTFNLCSVQLSDSIQRALNEQSATNGLEIVYCDYERTHQHSSVATDQVNLEIRKSCSRALKAFSRIYGYDKNGTEQGRDSYASEPGFAILSYQWQLGSLYFPQQVVKTQTDTDLLGAAPETYNHLLQTVDKYHKGLHGVSYFGIVNGLESVSRPKKGEFFERVHNQTGSGGRTLDFDLGRIASVYFGEATEGAVGSFVNEATTIGVSLERSNLFSLAGVPVNNSRVLALKAILVASDKMKVPKKAAAIVVMRDIVVHLKYVKMARVFLNNVEVEQ